MKTRSTLTNQEIFNDFYEHQPYEYRKISLKKEEPLFLITYEAHFLDVELENEKEGYIYYKPLLSKRGNLYLFKGKKKKPPKLYCNPKTNKDNRNFYIQSRKINLSSKSLAEWDILKRTLLDIAMLGIGVVIILLPFILMYYDVFDVYANISNWIV